MLNHGQHVKVPVAQAEKQPEPAVLHLSVKNGVRHVEVGEKVGLGAGKVRRPVAFLIVRLLEGNDDVHVPDFLETSEVIGVETFHLEVDGTDFTAVTDAVDGFHGVMDVIDILGRDVGNCQHHAFVALLHQPGRGLANLVHGEALALNGLVVHTGGAVRAFTAADIREVQGRGNDDAVTIGLPLHFPGRFADELLQLGILHSHEARRFFHGEVFHGHGLVKNALNLGPCRRRGLTEQALQPSRVEPQGRCIFHMGSLLTATGIAF